MNITVYLGANAGNDPALRDAVRALGRWIGESGNALVYGGSKNGLMGALAESVLAAGGRATGVEPQVFVDQGFLYDELTELIVTRDFPERKVKMLELGDAFIAFPGGTGTLEDLAVSYNERDAARAAGAKWDSIAKSWYAGPQADMEQLKRWLPENVKNEQLPAMTPREEFAEALRSVGCIVEGEHPLMDGAAHRIRTEGDRAGASSGFYVAYMDGRPAGYVKNNRTGEEVRWKTQGAFISQQDKAAFQAECARKQQERAKELLLEHEKTAERVAGQLSWMKQDVPTPYLDRKGLAPRRGVFLATDGKTTCIPAVDADGKLWSMQYIQEDGTKRFAKNSRKEGCFHPVGGMDALRTAPAIVIAEGYATAGSISDAIGHATVAAFDSGNLMAVATALKDKYPDKAVIIAGDDDLHLLNHPKVRANPGREKAETACRTV